MLGPTHLFFALALAYLLKLPKIPTAVAGIIPDLDYVLDFDFPLIHRGIVHTPLFMLISMLLLFLVTRNQPLTFGFGVGYLAHLLTDLITPTGIMFFYPIPTYFSLNLVAYNNILANLGIIVLSLGAILIYSSPKFHQRVYETFKIRLEAKT